jgi:hypothetical protein
MLVKTGRRAAVGPMIGTRQANLEKRKSDAKETDEKTHNGQ